LAGVNEAVIAFKSARKNMAFGTGKAGTPPSEGAIYSKLKGLSSKGFIEILASERTGTRIRIYTPFEIEGLIRLVSEDAYISLEDADFFAEPAYRGLILDRDGHRCFYCLKAVDQNNYVIEHVISRPIGTNSYRNLVASCRTCNNRKDAGLADDYLRLIYREGLLSLGEFQDRQHHLELLRQGELKPEWPLPAGDS
jgi:hypothetical protein